MESIIDYLKRKLKEAGARVWPAIASEVSRGLAPDDVISEHFLRKLAYGDRENPGLKSIQPLLDYFHEIERGERELPEPAKQGG